MTTYFEKQRAKFRQFSFGTVFIAWFIFASVLGQTILNMPNNVEIICGNVLASKQFN